jgi:hypothetical protein
MHHGRNFEQEASKLTSRNYSLKKDGRRVLIRVPE